ncbi:MAG: Holliday junction DNA helicase RuvA [Bacteroidia bacterium]|jgi:Holliday junction DNA helicase RuvA
MLEFIEGRVDEISPTHMVVSAGGVGYFAHISLYAYEQMKNMKEVKLLVHLQVKEDSHTLFGFLSKTERSIFRNLISVSGVGPAIARMIISSLSEQELISAITNGNVALLKSIKGIGPKAAQRLVLELRDKLGKLHDGSALFVTSNSNQQEAVEALMALGFARMATEKTVARVSKELGPDANTEELIKMSLKVL